MTSLLLPMAISCNATILYNHSKVLNLMRIRRLKASWIAAIKLYICYCLEVYFISGQPNFKMCMLSVRIAKPS